jgi:putative ABC transport system permease protein
MEGILRDVRHGLRALWRNWAFTAVAGLTLALAIAANTSIFGFVNAVVLRPLPFKDQDRLVMVWSTTPQKGQDTVVPADFFDWREQSHAFSDLAGFGFLGARTSGAQQAEQLVGASVTANFFSTLGVRPLLGRVFGPSDAGAARPVLLSHRLWQRSFEASPGVVGRALRINGQVATIVGVMGPEFAFPDRAELWVLAPRDVPELPMDPGEDPAKLRGLSYMRAFGRIAPGASLDGALAELNTIAKRLAAEYPKTNADRGVKLVPLKQQIVGDVGRAMLVLLIGSLLVLATACVNVANLFLARAISRSPEIAVRSALGANRRRLARQLVIESLLLTLFAGAVGLVLAYWGLKAIVAMSPTDLPRLNEVRLNPEVYVVSWIVILLMGFLVGLVPAARALRPGSVEVLKGTKASESGRRRSLRGLLVVTEVALSVVLLIGAGLLIKSLSNLQRVDPGFKTEGVLTFNIGLPMPAYADPVRQVAFFREARERLARLPGVESVGGVLSAPLMGDDINVPFNIEGKPKPESTEGQRDGLQVVTEGYFQAMGIRILSGRALNREDMDSPVGTAVLSETMARRYWPNEDPIGRRITYGDPSAPDATWYTIVGIAADVRHFGMNQEGRAESYVQYTKFPFPMMSFALRTANQDPASLAPQVRDVVRAIDSEQPVAALETLSVRVAKSIARERFTAYLVAAFAAVALILAVVGVYGLLAYQIAQRRQEIGIRMALGAQRADLLRQVVLQGLGLAGFGIVIGLVAAALLSRILRQMLFNVATLDVTTFTVVPSLLFLAATLACLVPAYRASRVEPLKALRSD